MGMELRFSAMALVCPTPLAKSSFFIVSDSMGLSLLLRSIMASTFFHSRAKMRFLPGGHGLGRRNKSLRSARPFHDKNGAGVLF
jgi:hypothetical protein